MLRLTVHNTFASCITRATSRVTRSNNSCRFGNLRHDCAPRKLLSFSSKNEVRADLEELRGHGFKFIRTSDNHDKSLIPYLQAQINAIHDLRTLSGFWPIWFLTKVLDPYAHLNLGADICYQIAKEHAELQHWATLGIPESYASWFSITLLHVWMVVVRLRAIEDQKLKKLLVQRIIDTFFVDVERGIVRVFNVTNPIIVGKSNQKFLRCYYGFMAAYDESLIKGDTALADAIYRNIYGMNPDLVTILNIEKIVIYIRSQMFLLSSVSQDDLIKGNWSFDCSLLLGKQC